MKVTHDSHFPGLNQQQFLRLMQDEAYQKALADNGKITRSHVQKTKHQDRLRLSWTSSIHCNLDRPYMLPLKTICSNGLTMQWRETHVYKGNHGDMSLEVQQPSRMQVTIPANEDLFMAPEGVVDRIEIDMSQACLPFTMRFIPGIKGIIASEVERGLSRADECTQKWLHDHPGRYTIPTTDEVL